MFKSACLLPASLLALAASAHAAPFFADDFESGSLSNWTTPSANWSVVTTAGNKYATNNIKVPDANQYLTHVLNNSITESFSARFSYDWNWGGSTSSGNGAYSQVISMQMLNAAGDGYSVQVRQGINAGPANAANLLISIYTVVGGVQTGSALASGPGYNRTGWNSVGLGAPRITPVELRWDSATGQLSAWYNNAGTMTLSASATNTAYTSFDRITIIAGGYGNKEQPLIDNVSIDPVPEAASLSLLSLGALALLRRR